MGEVTEKIYCCDRGDNDNALAAAILAGNNRRDDWGPMANSILGLQVKSKSLWKALV